MKISFLSLLLIVLLSSCVGEDDQKEGKSSNGSDSSESENIEALAAEAVDFEKSLELKRVDGVKLVHDSTTQKLFTGWAKATRENGQLVDLVHVKNGSALTIYEFYENGKKHFKIENSKDRKIKSAISWKPNGEKCPETNVNNGNGVFVRYFETGRKESEQNFKDYEKDGVCTDWYENGNKSKEVSYKNGKLDGFEIFYHEDGTEEIRFIYKDGEQIGRHKEGEGEPAKPSGDPELANEKVKEARSAAEKIATDTLTPAQRWEKLSAYSASYGNCLEDLEVRKSLDQAVASAFVGAGDHLVQESQDEFLLKTQDKELKFLPKAEVERKRAQVVAKMCDRILEQMKGDDFDVVDGKDFVEMFEDTPRVRKDEKGNPMPLQEVDYSRFTENKFILDKLQEISASLARMEDSNERKQQSLEELQAKIARFDKEVLIAWKKFRDTGEVDHGILAQESYLDGLDSESREFSGDEAIDPNDYREVRSALRELRSTWKSFSKEIESKSGSQIDTLLNEAEKIGGSLSRASPEEKATGLKKMGEILEQVTGANKSASKEMRMSPSQERRLRELLEMRSQVISKVKKAGEAMESTGAANSVEEYLFSLEKGLEADAFAANEIQSVRSVLAHRNKFSNEKGELRKKLFLKGPPDIWDKLEKGEISLMNDDSKEEYDYLKSLMERYQLLNLWSYRLVKCVPLKTARAGIYNTNKEPVLPQLLSYGEVVEKKSQKNFDEEGQPIANPPVTITQTGMFHWNGKKEGREFPTTHFNGGIEGLMLDSAQLSPESKFMRLQIDRRMNPSTRTLDRPLMEMLEVVIAEQTASVLLKAYLHMEIVEMMKKKPAAWGVALSGQLIQDYQDLLARVRVRIRPTDWMDAQNYKELTAVLAAFYRELGKRDYFSESRFTLDLLGELQKIDFGYVGYVDASGQKKFASSAPPVYWGLQKGTGNQLKLVQASARSAPNFQPRSPLIATVPPLEKILAQSYSNAQVEPGKYGTVDDLLPIDFSQN